MSYWHALDRHEVAGAVQHQNKKHSPGKFGVECSRYERKTVAQSVFDDAPSVECRAGIGQGKTEQNSRETKLLKAEYCGHQPTCCRGHTECDRAPRRAIGSRGMRQVSTQEPRCYVGHAYAEIGRAS